jgi:hypothetical protein
MNTMNMNATSSHQNSRGNSMITKLSSRLCAIVAAMGLAGTVGVAGTGCVEPATDINRVQPNYHSKEIFKGEWYHRQTIVDKQYHVSYPFIGYEGGLDRIRWEVTQDRLIAFRSYEKVPGTEGADPGEQSVVAVFPIISHFDIRRDYNPVSGVESNVIGENTWDRPWWERDYIRVNWASNLADDFDLNGYVRSFQGGVVTDNANADPVNPWKVRSEDSDGDGAVDYLETTISAIAQADIWACVLSSGDWYNNCQGADVKLKISFMRLPENPGYEPLNYMDFEPQSYGVRADPLTQQIELCFEGESGCVSSNCVDECSFEGNDTATCLTQCEGTPLDDLWVASGPFGGEICNPEIHNPDDCFQYTINRFAKFGYFRTDRYLYDRENGYTYEGRERMINRWDIWETAYDEEGNLLPYADRTPKPIVFYTNTLFPESLIPATTEMADDWDRAFRETVAELQGVDPSTVPRMFEFRQNNCNADNLNAYMDDWAEARDFRGDLRAHGITELAYGNMENACAVVEHYGRRMFEFGENPENFDVFRWEQLGDVRYSFLNWVAKAEVSGPLGYGPSAADPVTGEIISANANIYGASLDTYANWGADIVQLLNGDITQGDVINGSHVREYIQTVRTRYKDPMSQERISKFIGVFDQRTGNMSDNNYKIEVPLTAINENLDRLADTGFEEEFLLNADTALLFGGAHSKMGEFGMTGIPDDVMARAKPSNWARQSAPLAMMTNNPDALDAAFEVNGMNRKMSAAERFQQKLDFFGRQNACYTQEMVEPAVADLAADLMDQGLDRAGVVAYIRANIYRGVMAHEVGHTLGLRHNFEGTYDPMNFFPAYWGVENEDYESFNSRREELKYSSIMDYHQRFNADFGGIGLYDKAAIKFGYGELVEVFDEGRFDTAIGGYEDAFVPRGWDDSLTGLFYPSDIPYLLAGGTAGDVLDNHVDDVIDELIAGDPDVFVDVKSLNITPRPENIYKRKYIQWDEYKRQRMRGVFGLDNPDGSPPLVEVPYMYCSDMYAWGGNISCNRYDMGVTAEEIVGNAAEMYEFYYPFQAFRGHRMWDMSDPVGGYMGRLQSRTFQPMLNAFRFFYFYRRSTASIWPLIRDWSAAAFRGMNFFARVLQTPEPGRYCLQGDMYVPEDGVETCDNATSFNLPLGDARYYDMDWTNEFEFRPQHVGHIYDKLMAVQSMTTSNAFFLRNFSNFFSRGAFSIGYYRVFQPEIIQLFGGLIRGDTTKFAPQVTINGKPEVVFKPFVALPGEEFVDVGQSIKPTESWYMRYWTMFFGMANLTSNVDLTLDFQIRNRITLKGAMNDPEVDPSVLQIEWMDPTSMQVYKAAAPDGPDLNIGYQMLSDMKDLTNDGTDGDPEGPWHAAMVARDDAQAALDAADPMDANYGDLEDALDDAEVAFARQGTKLYEGMQLVDALRQLTDVLEFSP